MLWYSAGRPAQAVDDLDHAIELADDAALRINRAIALDDIDGALDDWRAHLAAYGQGQVRRMPGRFSA